MTTTDETTGRTQPNPWCWTHEQYYRVAETGIFEGKRVELIGGEIIEMSAVGDRHWLALILVRDVLIRALADGHFVSVQSPVWVSDVSDPEPDIAVIQGQPRDYIGTIPDTATMVVEVSDSTLAYDRTEKNSLYASAGIAEYWIVNLVENQVEVYRWPAAHPTATFGYAYLDLSVHRESEAVTPLARPDVTIPVADVLP